MKDARFNNSLLWLGADEALGQEAMAWAERLKWQFHQVKTHNQLLRALKHQTYDLVILDAMINGGNSLLHLPEIREIAPHSVISVRQNAFELEAGNRLLRDLQANYVDHLLRPDFGRNDFEAVLIDTRYRKLHAINPQHVLIVDDCRTIRKILLKALKHKGYRVSEARSAEEALGRVDLAHVDAVITDIFMPGMGGIEAIMRFRILWPEMAIVAISSGDKHMNATTVLLAASKIGADAVLPKPFSDEELLSKVDVVLKAKYLAA